MRSCTRSGEPQYPAPRATISPACRSVKRQRIPCDVRHPRMVIRSRCVSVKSIATTTNHDVAFGSRWRPRYSPTATIEPSDNHVARTESSDFATTDLSRFLWSRYATKNHSARVMTLSGNAKILIGKLPASNCNSRVVATIAATVIASIAITFLSSASISLKYLRQS